MLFDQNGICGYFGYMGVKSEFFLNWWSNTRATFRCVPGHGCSEPTKSGRGVRSPRNPAGVFGAHEIRQRDSFPIYISGYREKWNVLWKWKCFERIGPTTWNVTKMRKSMDTWVWYNLWGIYWTLYHQVDLFWSILAYSFRCITSPCACFILYTLSVGRKVSYWASELNLSFSGTRQGTWLECLACGRISWSSFDMKLFYPLYR